VSLCVSLLTVGVAALGVSKQSEDKVLVGCETVVVGAADSSETSVHT